ncbi:MAG TPA: right-handed parallel beta-helix repeat-containing protein [Terriglobales bacterium]|nr:right-handed parallel beta-helix repeat-containing protein [Terriglobales bacterium]
MYFTSYKDDSYGGDTNSNPATNLAKGNWKEIQIESGGSATLTWAVIRYGGYEYGSTADIWVTGGSLTLSNSDLSYGYTYGLLQESGSTAVSDSTIHDNTNYGINGYGGTLDLTGNTFVNNYYPVYVNVAAVTNFTHSNNSAATKVSEGTIFFEDDGRPCFAFNPGIGIGAAFMSIKPSPPEIERSRDLGKRVVGTEDLDSVCRLLVQSYDTGQDALRHFLAAWMALEVSVTKNSPPMKTSS